MKNDELKQQVLNPIRPDLEAIAQRITKGILGKPGFITNDATKDYLIRGVRLAILEAIRIEKHESNI